MQDRGEWYVVATFSDEEMRKARSMVANFRRGVLRVPGDDPSRWEFTAQKVEGEIKVYARYLG